jgi:hypothetical protein
MSSPRELQASDGAGVLNLLLADDGTVPADGAPKTEGELICHWLPSM